MHDKRDLINNDSFEWRLETLLVRATWWLRTEFLQLMKLCGGWSFLRTFNSKNYTSLRIFLLKHKKSLLKFVFVGILIWCLMGSRFFHAVFKRFYQPWMMTWKSHIMIILRCFRRLLDTILYLGRYNKIIVMRRDVDFWSQNLTSLGNFYTYVKKNYSLLLSAVEWFLRPLTSHMKISKSNPHIMFTFILVVIPL